MAGAVANGTKGTWIGGLPMLTPVGTLLPGTREEMADAFLYLGPRDSLTALKSRASDLEATAYGRETQRRLAIRFERSPDTFLPKSDDQTQPLFSRTASTPPPLRALPKPRP